jgi:hypothetical protein
MTREYGKVTHWSETYPPGTDPVVLLTPPRPDIGPPAGAVILLSEDQIAELAHAEARRVLDALRGGARVWLHVTVTRSRTHDGRPGAQANGSHWSEARRPGRAPVVALTPPVPDVGPPEGRSLPYDHLNKLTRLMLQHLADELGHRSGIEIRVTVRWYRRRSDRSNAPKPSRPDTTDEAPPEAQL